MPGQSGPDFAPGSVQRPQVPAQPRRDILDKFVADKARMGASVLTTLQIPKS